MSEQATQPIQPLYVFVNGILSDPENVKGWQQVAERYITKSNLGQADEYSYNTGVARLGQEKHAENLAAMLRDYQEAMPRIALWGHSNGVELALKVLRENPDITVATLGCLAGAASADCDDNGINLICQRNQVAKIVVQYSDADDVLRLGPIAGYGRLGLRGPVNIGEQAIERLQLVATPGLSHSDPVYGRFLQTMTRIVIAESVSPMIGSPKTLNL